MVQFLAIAFVDSNYQCPKDEKYTGMSEVEKIMYGNFKVQYPTEFVRAMPTEDINVKEYWGGGQSFKKLVEQALARINQRCIIVRNMLNIDEIVTTNRFNADTLTGVWYLIDFLFSYINRIFIGYYPMEDFIDDPNDFNDPNDSNVVIAYNNLSAMKRRLQDRLEKFSPPLDLENGSIFISLRDIILSAHWSDDVRCRGASSPPPMEIKFGVNIILCNSKILYNVGHWDRMFTCNWIRCMPGKKKQPVYLNKNFKKNRCYTKSYSPYFREVLSVNEGQLGSLYEDLQSDKVLFKFPFEVDYDLTEKGQYNVKKTSRYIFENNSVMDHQTNPYFIKREINGVIEWKKHGNGKFMSGATAHDATWVKKEDIDQWLLQIKK